jgi:ABC-type sugar transport system permease subunit
MKSSKMDISKNTQSNLLKPFSEPGRHPLTPYLFLLPYVALFLTFNIYPYIVGIQMSFSKMMGFRMRGFTGFTNFEKVLGDKRFWMAAEHSFKFMLGSLVTQVPMAFLLAILLNDVPTKLKGFLRAAFFVPVLISGAVASIIFTMLFRKEFGIVNWIIGLVTGGRIADINWINSPALAMPLMLIISFWMWTGFHMVYFLASLQAIEPGLYEAARIDGASWWQRTFRITLPLMRPAFIFVMVTSAIGGLQLFDLPFMLWTGGGYGPGKAGLMFMTYLYNFAFRTNLVGHAVAAGWLIFIALLLWTVFQLKVLGVNRPVD